MERPPLRPVCTWTRIPGRSSRCSPPSHSLGCRSPSSASSPSPRGGGGGEDFPNQICSVTRKNAPNKLCQIRNKVKLIPWVMLIFNFMHILAMIEHPTFRLPEYNIYLTKSHYLVIKDTAARFFLLPIFSCEWVPPKVLTQYSNAFLILEFVLLFLVRNPLYAQSRCLALRLSKIVNRAEVMPSILLVKANIVTTH